MTLPESTMPFDRIYQELEKHRQKTEKDLAEKRDLAALVSELRRQLDQAASTLEQGFHLTHRTGPLQYLVEEVIRVSENRVGDLVAETEGQRVENASLQARITQLEEEIRTAVVNLVAYVELPPNRIRSLGSAVAEAGTVVQEAKKMIQDSL